MLLKVGLVCLMKVVHVWTVDCQSLLNRVLNGFSSACLKVGSHNQNSQHNAVFFSSCRSCAFPSSSNEKCFTHLIWRLSSAPSIKDVVISPCLLPEMTSFNYSKGRSYKLQKPRMTVCACRQHCLHGNITRPSHSWETHY